MSEMLTLEVPSGTRRRLEMLGFPHGISGSEVVHFLIRDGLDVLERHRRHEGNRAPSNEAGGLVEAVTG
jgi:hypothetical protein